MTALITEEPPDSADAAALVADLEAHLGPMHPAESRHVYSVEKLLREKVSLFVLRRDGVAAGCGGLQLFGTAYAEVKRMHVRPQFRGTAFGELMLKHLAEYARKHGAPVRILGAVPARWRSADGESRSSVPTATSCDVSGGRWLPNDGTAIPQRSRSAVPTEGEAMRRALVMIAFCATLAGVNAALAAESRAIQFLNSGKVLPKDLPFSEAVRVGNTLYLSGQIGVVPGSLKLVDGGIKAETRQTMENIKTSLEANGYAMKDLVKCTVMLADISEWGTFNEVYKSYFSGRYPARSALGANGLALGARVEVECIAAAGN